MSRSLRLALVPLLLLGCNQSLRDSEPPVADPGFTAPPPTAPSGDEDPEQLGSAAWDPERAEEVLDATWYGDVLVSNDAFIIEQSQTFAGLTAPAGSSVVTIDFTAPAAKSGLRDGSVLVTGLNGGLLRRVESVSFEGNRATAITSAAVLTDVIYVARHFERVALTLQPGDLPEGPARDPYTYDFSGTPLFSAGSGANQVAVDVQSGVVTLDPGFDWGLDVDWFDWDRPWPKLETADLGVTLDADLELVAHHAVTQLPPPDGAMRPSIAVEGDLAVVTYDVGGDIQMVAVTLEIAEETDGDGADGSSTDDSDGGGSASDGDAQPQPADTASAPASATQRPCGCTAAGATGATGWIAGILCLPALAWRRRR